MDILTVKVVFILLYVLVFLTCVIGELRAKRRRTYTRNYYSNNDKSFKLTDITFCPNKMTTYGARDSFQIFVI